MKVTVEVLDDSRIRIFRGILRVKETGDVVVEGVTPCL